MTPRSFLFVPADAPAKIAKAQASGADAVILDIEDSVALSAKPQAREVAAQTLAGPRAGPELWVRVNPLASGLALADLAAVIPHAPAGIVLPKPDSVADVVTLAHYLDAFEAAAGLAPGRTRILPIATETPASVFSLGSYVSAGPRLAGLTWGAEDLPAAIGATQSRNPDGSLNDLCRMVRSLCLAGAAAAGVPAIETVYPDFRDEAGLRAWAEAGRREGFTAMLAIHPAQVAVINAVMTPSAADIAAARAVIAAFAATPGVGVVALDGKMLDRPHLTQAQKTLARMRED
ncbi:CoA ester lyase [Acidocella sp. KAb 2-4]|uniref:HpcH/HpaI aldolase/citrate lyase family protein n=1 Tax=Acidocella sp. KAb 2-4 TaxID=2885158 RepID=UPI001D094B7F|nr:CoA ester lyase [Acidocella sp. KAb 2-4]MCB5944706.1 CoA ester lyase [Acidocella sp. KAb 2-4]